MNAFCRIWLPLFRPKFSAESNGSHEVNYFIKPWSRISHQFIIKIKAIFQSFEFGENLKIHSSQNGLHLELGTFFSIFGPDPFWDILTKIQSKTGHRVKYLRYPSLNRKIILSTSFKLKKTLYLHSYECFHLSTYWPGTFYASATKHLGIDMLVSQSVGKSVGRLDDLKNEDDLKNKDDLKIVENHTTLPNTAIAVIFL